MPSCNPKTAWPPLSLQTSQTSHVIGLMSLSVPFGEMRLMMFELIASDENCFHVVSPGCVAEKTQQPVTIAGCFTQRPLSQRQPSNIIIRDHHKHGAQGDLAHDTARDSQQDLQARRI